MKGRKSIALIILFLTAGALNSCRIDMFNKLAGGGSATVTPLDGQWIAASGTVNAEIIVQYGTSMDIGITPVLSGALGSGTVNTDIEAQWSTTDSPDDTLTLKPLTAGVWPVDINNLQNINITCKTQRGKEITVNYSFKVASQLRYVSKLSGGTTPDGSRNAPHQDFATALGSMTASVTEPGVLLAAAGNYDSVCPAIDLNKNVSLYGGWTTDWRERDPANNVSLISPPATDGSAALLIQSENVLAATVVDGFTVSMTEPAGGTTWTGVLIDKSYVTLRNMIISSGEIGEKSSITLRGMQVLSGSTAKISDCTISLGSFKRNVVTTANNKNTGIYVNSSSPDISNVSITTAGSVDTTMTEVIGVYYDGSPGGKISNSTISLGSQIDATTAALNCKNYGIYITNSSPDISDMNIHAGEVIMKDNTSGIAYGIYISNGSPTIHDNAMIHGGRASQKSYALYLENASSTIENNNTIDGGDSQTAGGSSHGLHIATSSSPIIEYNKITVTSGVETCGIEIYSDSSPIIRKNFINPGSNAELSHGIKMQNLTAGSVEVNNNVILGGDGTGNSYGIHLVRSSTNIRNNTINGGNGGTATAMWLNMEGPTTDVVNIQSNLIFADKTEDSYGIFENATYTSDPNFIDHNNFFNLEFSYYDRLGGDVSTSDVNNGTLIQGSNALEFNYDEELYNVLDSATEYKIKDSLDYVDYSFTTRGMNGTGPGWLFTDDKDGDTRTDPWSIGAYQYP